MARTHSLREGFGEMDAILTRQRVLASRAQRASPKDDPPRVALGVPALVPEGGESGFGRTRGPVRRPPGNQATKERSPASLPGFHFVSVPATPSCATAAGIR